MTHNAQPVAQPMPTLTPEALKALIHEVLQEREKKSRVDDIDSAVIKAFRRKGFDQVTPRIDTRTFNLWAQEGLRPKEGERSVKVGSLRLFHRSQCRPLTPDDRAGQSASPVEQPASTLKAQTKKTKPLPTSEQPSPQPSA